MMKKKKTMIDRIFRCCRLLFPLLLLLFHIVVTGAFAAEASCRSTAEQVLARYLSSATTTTTTDFYIQGWRWHSMSLIHEAGRLHQLATRLALSTAPRDLSDLQTATDYTVQFNMRGLHSIEKDVFFPWLRTKTQSMMMQKEQPEVVRAFATLLQDLDQERNGLESLGSLLLQQAGTAANPSASWEARQRAVQQVAHDAATLAAMAQARLQREEAYLVPAVAFFATAAEQKAVNRQVIRKLGIWDARLHLVGMHEAIARNPVERRLFQQMIPSLPQKLIPRWKRLIYEPRAGALEKLLAATTTSSSSSGMETDGDL